MREITTNEPVLSSIIARIPAWQEARDIQAERITGLINANYRLTVAGERFVLRISGQNTERLGISRADELAALQNAASARIGPEVIAYLLLEGHLVTRWVEGYHWSAEEFHTPAHVRLLTETVKRIHHLPPSGAVFSPFQRVAAFLESVRSFKFKMPEGLEGILATMQAIQVDEQADPSAWQRFCHNDLVSVNYLFLEAEQRITVLDWEFSGLGDLYYDLATIVYTHDSDGSISTELAEVMLECYFGPVTAFQRRRLAGMKFMLMLFTAAWGLAQAGMQRAGLIPAVEGFDYGEFAEYLFANDIRERQADYCSGLRYQVSTL